MQPFNSLLQNLESRLEGSLFPKKPIHLYAPADYILRLGGKRVRPILCLMGSELFEVLSENNYNAAIAIEIFHNFTLVHDDIMDKAPLRRGKPTVHEKYNPSVAILSGDVMFVQAYEYLNKVETPQKKKLFNLFSQTAKEVCEGQQLDMDLEDKSLEEIDLEDYLHMITLKTSVLLAGSLQIGALIAGADDFNQKKLYAFGKNIGLAFQIQDDYLDAFGSQEKFGKQIGGDILTNKKTFLLLKAYERATANQKKEMLFLLKTKDSPKEKIDNMIAIFKACKVDFWAQKQKEKYIDLAEKELDQVKVEEGRKAVLKDLMHRLFNRES